jgi:glutamine synthetase
MEQRDDPREYVLRMAKENDVKFIRLWFTDILGNLKGFALTVAELEGALERGMAFDGSVIEGFARHDESDMVAMPDPNTFSILPWRPRQNAVAKMICDVVRPNGEPFEGDPRYVLKRNLQRASEMGFAYMVGPEMEHFYFRSDDATEPLDQGGYFDMTPLDGATDIRRDTVLALEDLGIPVEYSHHEGAKSQHEIDLRHTDALTMADAVMTYRLTVKEIARKHGVYATFMPKPVEGQNGSGMHVNQSLFQGEENAFYDEADPHKLSEMAHRYIAGLLRHAPEITAVCCQWVNSYKRLVPGFEAPIYTTWAGVNRADMVRIPSYRQGREESMRLEFRLPDATCNPYLAFSVMLAAGLEGIQQGYPAVSAAEGDVALLTARERSERRIEQVPSSLYEAVLLAERSELVKRALGPHTFQTFIENKRIEWEQFNSAVTDYELKRYLPML